MTKIEKIAMMEKSIRGIATRLDKMTTGEMLRSKSWVLFSKRVSNYKNYCNDNSMIDRQFLFDIFCAEEGRLTSASDVADTIVSNEDTLETYSPELEEANDFLCEVLDAALLDIN